LQEQRIWVGPSRITTNDAAILEYDLVGAVVAGFEEEELIFVGGIEGPSCVFHDGEVHGFDARGRGIGSAIGERKEFCAAEAGLAVEDGFVAEVRSVRVSSRNGKEVLDGHFDSFCASGVELSGQRCNF